MPTNYEYTPHVSNNPAVMGRQRSIALQHESVRYAFEADLPGVRSNVSSWPKAAIRLLDLKVRFVDEGMPP